MGLLVPDPPKDSLAALRESLSALAQRGSFSARGLREARAEQISATIPHQVFNLTLEDARRGAVVELARPNGWRYLLTVDEQVVASAETRSQKGEPHAFSNVNAGPFVFGTVEALTVAEKVADADERALELRILNVPAVYLMSVWLQPSGADERDESIYIPVAPAPRGFEPNRTYPSNEFVERLRALAQAVPELEPDDARGGA